MAGSGRTQQAPAAVHRKIQQNGASAEKTRTTRACDLGVMMITLVRDGERHMSLPSDEIAVRTLYTHLMDGWNAGSGEAFAAPFAEACDFIAFDGTRFSERDAIVRFHDPLFQTHLKGTRLVGEVTGVRFLGPDVAVMHATGGTIGRGRTQPARERDSIQTLVAVRQQGAWRLVAFQNTRVRPIGQNVRGTLLWLVSDWLWKWCLPKRA
jgi:uncharacterized protein (TIGR02246 family)